MRNDLFLRGPLACACYSAFATIAIVMFLAACGSSASSSGSGAYSTNGASTPAASGSGSSLKMATATVGGKSVSILTDSRGMTLYYRTSDAPPATVCSAGCAQAWPPLIASGSAAPTSAVSLPGALTTVTDANGKQVEYNGHPLYHFAGDKAVGQTAGNALAGVWFVATPTLQAQGTQQAAPTPTKAAGGGGY